MLLQQARTVCWKKWAAKHEYEELKEGVWLEPALALMRKKTKEDWTEKHRNVARKLVLEVGCRKNFSTLVWSDKKRMPSLPEGGRHRKAQAPHCPELYEVRRGNPEGFRKWEQKAKNLKKEWKWQRGMVALPLCESKWSRDHFSLQQWESEKHKSWGMTAQVFKSHAASDGSPLVERIFGHVWFPAKEHNVPAFQRACLNVRCGERGPMDLHRRGVVGGVAESVCKWTPPYIDIHKHGQTETDNFPPSAHNRATTRNKANTRPNQGTTTYGTSRYVCLCVAVWLCPCVSLCLYVCMSVCLSCFFQPLRH